MHHTTLYPPPQAEASCPVAPVKGWRTLNANGDREESSFLSPVLAQKHQRSFLSYQEEGSESLATSSLLLQLACHAP